MIETDNLRTASLYINNQLLSRGLLADGHSIDFANPVDDDGDATITMGRIMRVVNDLILRRDVRRPLYRLHETQRLTTITSVTPSTVNRSQPRCGTCERKAPRTPAIWHG